LLFTGCAISLDGATPDASSGPTAPLVPGCRLFQGADPGVSLLQGPGTSVTRADGTVLWMFSGALLADGGSLGNGVLAQVQGDDPAGCFPRTPLSTAAAFAPSPLGSALLVNPLAQIEVPRGTWSYYQLLAWDSTAAFGLRSEGFGVAPLDGGTFAPGPSVLWAGDSPSYGSGAVVFDGGVFVYGCAPMDGGGSACFGAEAPVDQLDDAAAYSYAMGSDRMTSDPTAAEPILDGANGVSIFPHPSGRWVATFTGTFFPNTISVRTALSPLGPFSQPRDLLTCDLGDGDFCSGGVQHPELEADAGEVVVSYVPTTFDGASAGNRYWPRLASAPLPADLP
jgi:hypothetical protein